MRIKLIIIVIFCIMILAETVTAGSPYGKMDVYYNGKILPAKEIPKPLLKIGEPFTIGINLTVYQKSEVSIELSEIGEGYFEILNGPTSEMNVYRVDVIEENFTKMYEWTVAPTEKWAGGSIPIDVVYQIDDFGTWDRLVQGGFTVAYCTISTEYYEGETLTTPKSASSEPETSSESAPAFTTFGTFLAVALAASRR